MAKNYTAAEAVKIIREGKDLGAMQDIGGRFPLFAMMTNGDIDSLVKLLKSIPESITVRKMETVLKSGVEATEEDETEEDEAEEIEEDNDEADEEEADLKSLKAKELMVLCKEKGIEAKPNRKKDYYIKLLEAPAEEAEDDEAEAYEDMQPKDLFALCKEREIKVVSKKKADYYIKKLEEADAANESNVEEDDDWDI